MIQIETKFNIGDEVRYPVPETVYEKITCPYCKGTGLIDISPEEQIGCEMCDDGVYEKEVWRQVWSSTQEVIGAIVGKDYFRKPMKDIVYIIVGTPGMTHTIPEYRIKYANEVKGGDIIDA